MDGKEKGEPKKDDIFYFQAKVIHVKYKKNYIEVRLEEYHSKSRFNLKYFQPPLPGLEDQCVF